MFKKRVQVGRAQGGHGNPIDSLQQFFARLCVTHCRSAKRLVKCAIEGANVLQVQRRSDAALPQVENRTAQKTVLRDHLVQIEATPETVNGVDFRQGAQRGGGRRLLRTNQFRNASKDGGQVVDDGRFGKFPRG